MACSLEHVLHLFDTVWFQNKIFHTTFDKKCQHKFLYGERKGEEPEKTLQDESTPTLKVRPHSDNLLKSGVSFLADFQSSTSVLPTPRLQTIFSGKEVADDFVKPDNKKDPNDTVAAPAKPCLGKRVKNRHRRRGRAGPGSSKSLTDLQFDEVQGFKDLGFMFSEEDSEDADLVSIVPGLQRLRKSDGNEADKRLNVLNVQRPYLSESWDVMEKTEALLKPAALIINDRVRQAGVNNEMAIKEQLKCWAHLVATAIR